MHKSPTPFRHSNMNQARSEDEEKEKRDGKDRGQVADGKKSSPTKENPIRGTKTRPACTAQVNVKNIKLKIANCILPYFPVVPTHITIVKI